MRQNVAPPASASRGEYSYPRRRNRLLSSTRGLSQTLQVLRDEHRAQTRLKIAELCAGVVVIGEGVDEPSRGGNFEQEVGSQRQARGHDAAAELLDDVHCRRSCYSADPASSREGSASESRSQAPWWQNRGRCSPTRPDDHLGHARHGPRPALFGRHAGPRSPLSRRSVPRGPGELGSRRAGRLRSTRPGTGGPI